MPTEKQQRDAIALVALGDQVQQACIDSPIEVADLIVFAESGATEFRSHYALEEMKQHIIEAGEAL